MTLRAKDFPLLERCVEEGLALGWTRAHKYAEAPTEAAIMEQLGNAVLSEILEWFEIEQGEELVE